MINDIAKSAILPLALLIAAGSAAALAPTQAAAEEVRISASDSQVGDPQALVQIRRRIGSAARALCGSNDLGAVYGNARERCRRETIADAERQLRERQNIRTASR